MRYRTEVLLCVVCAFVAAQSVYIIDDSNKQEEQEEDDEDRLDHGWEMPDLRGTGLVSLDGDIVVPIEETYSRKGADFDLLFGQLLKWRDGVVSYWFDRGLTSRHRRILSHAMRHWEENTCLKFVPASLFQFTFYINFRSDRDGCYSLVGRMLLGQDINMGNNCLRYRTAIHEIGHAIGFYHEQSRSDRDKYIKILWENMDRGEKRQFRKVDDNPKGVPYDYSSVMQYPAGAFTADIEKNTIVSRDPFMQLALGGTKLSFRDRKMASAMYNCDEKCPNRNTLKCENGGFMFQRHGSVGDCRCTCPPNTSGDRCEILLKRSYHDYPKCGGNITSEGTIQTLNAPKTAMSDGGCIFWIQAPQGKHPEVEFNFFKFGNRRLNLKDPKSIRRCRSDRVEIRTESIYEGKMYCSNDLERKTITSPTNYMIIIATPKYSDPPGGFRGTVRFIDSPNQKNYSG